MDDRRKNLILAQLAEQAEQYADGLGFILNIVPSETDLTDEEFRLLKVFSKNSIGTLRGAFRALSRENHKAELREVGSDHVLLIKEYTEVVKARLVRLVLETMAPLLELQLSKTAIDNHPARVNLLKMIADYYRYLAELTTSGESEYTPTSEQHYIRAQEQALQFLHVADPTRLGLALNYSVFLYEIKQMPEAAGALAKNTYDQAREFLEDDSDANYKDAIYKDATAIMQLIRDNVALWNPTENTDAPS